MGKKISAFENWQTKFEEMTGDEETGDTNIDITVIANSDGEAAEDAITADEMADDVAAADAAEEAQDAAEEEAEELKELAAVIRQHGLNPGMVAMLDVLLPTQSLGIYLPAKESLDAHGTNRGYAENVAAALEASSDSFWEKTKTTVGKIWQWIRDFITKAISRIGTAKSKVARMGETLLGRQFNPNRNEKAKLPIYKKFFNPADISATSSTLNAVKAVVGALGDAAGKFTKDAQISFDVFASMRESDMYAIFGGKNNIEAAGNIKIKDTRDKNNNVATLTYEEDDSKFFDKDDTEASQDIFDLYKKNGKIYELVDSYTDGLKNMKQIETNLKGYEKTAQAKMGDVNKSADARDVMNEGAKNYHTFANVFKRAVTNTIKILNLTISAYLAGGRVLISCSLPSGSSLANKYEK